MPYSDISITSLVANFRANAEDDIAFAQRVAEACAVIAERCERMNLPADRDVPAAIRGVFGIG